jgi:2'-5' RNA ligase
MLAKERQNACMDPLIAVDIAILPPAAVTQVAMDLSAALPASESQGLRLDADRRPHVTLTQQFIARNALPDAVNAVAGVLRDCRPLPLMITGPGRGARSVWMQVGRTPELLDLHRSLMGAMRSHEQTGGTGSAFVQGDARPGDVKWVSGFRRTSSFARYTPHITLGHASSPPHVDPLSFMADTIALCHLGRFCTCREVLHAWTLEMPSEGKGGEAR